MVVTHQKVHEWVHIQFTSFKGHEVFFAAYQAWTDRFICSDSHLLWLPDLKLSLSTLIQDTQTSLHFLSELKLTFHILFWSCMLELCFLTDALVTYLCPLVRMWYFKTGSFFIFGFFCTWCHTLETHEWQNAIVLCCNLWRGDGEPVACSRSGLRWHMPPQGLPEICSIRGSLYPVSHWPLSSFFFFFVKDKILRFSIPVVCCHSCSLIRTIFPAVLVIELSL